MFTINVKGMGSHKFDNPKDASKFLRSIKTNGIKQTRLTSPGFGTTKDGKTIVVYGKVKNLKW